MRFLTTLLALIPFVSADLVGTFNIDIGGDNSFQVFLSRASSPSTYSELKTNWEYPTNAWVQVGSSKVKQTTWESPSRYQNVELYEDDVLSVYVHNEVISSNNVITTNPSAIVARIKQTDGSIQYVTDSSWRCIWRHENRIIGNSPDQIGDLFNNDAEYNPDRLTGNKNWARQNYIDTVNVPVLYPITGQQGPTNWADATEITPLGTAIWNTVAAKVDEGLGTESPTPFWIFGNDQHQQANDPNPTTKIAHHGWCRFQVPRKGFSGGNGDPVFSGFQGQSFQFHGLPDEHFNLISTPTVQLNAHFVYLSSGKCDYNNTACFTHPGTYMDVLGFSIGAERHIKLIAGTHDMGLRVWIEDQEVPRGAYIKQLHPNITSSLHYKKDGTVVIHTDLIDYKVINSDMFFNFEASLSDAQLLRAGSTPHTVTDSKICHTNTETHNHELIESTVAKKYHINTPLHGLVGQTWRNVKVCGRDWMGTVQDYLVSSLFGSEYHYNVFQYGKAHSHMMD